MNKPSIVMSEEDKLKKILGDLITTPTEKTGLIKSGATTTFPIVDVLWVEPSLEIRQLLTPPAREAGAHVLAVADVSRATRLLQTHPFNIIIVNPLAGAGADPCWQAVYAPNARTSGLIGPPGLELICSILNAGPIVEISTCMEPAVAILANTGYLSSPLAQEVQWVHSMTSFCTEYPHTIEENFLLKLLGEILLTDADLQSNEDAAASLPASL